MDVKLLRERLFVRWIANRSVRKWNVFGKVIEVTDGNFKILTFDDFKTHQLDKDGSAIKNEITIANIEDVISFLSIQLTNLNELTFEVEKKYREDSDPTIETEHKYRHDMNNIKEDILIINNCLKHLRN